MVWKYIRENPCKTCYGWNPEMASTCTHEHAASHIMLDALYMGDIDCASTRDDRKTVNHPKTTQFGNRPFLKQT